MSVMPRPSRSRNEEFSEDRAVPSIGVERIPFTNRDQLAFDNPMLAPDLLRFRVEIEGDTRLELVSLDGRHGVVLLDAPLRSGWHSVALPEGLRSGTYFVRMASAAGRTSALMVVMR
jgi:hypothetical protein